MNSSETNPDIEKILDKICSTDFLAPEFIRKSIEASLKELHRREWICDLKIVDYIEQNFCEQQLFYSPNHPVSVLLLEMTLRILKFIDFKSTTFSNLTNILSNQNIDYSLIGQDTPIYPSVLDQLNLKVYSNMYWANCYLWKFRANFRDFMHEYIKQCWADKFTR